MGGHGGLNILPQKRWNVYNRDNRLKVARDEEKQREQDEQTRQRHVQAEREFRHRQLLDKVRQQGPVGSLPSEDSNNASGQALGTDSNQQEPAALEHINFWKEDETKAQHPEVEAEKKAEVKRRGNKDTYTSDPKFDERFQFGYGMAGDKPWYAQMSTTPSSAQAAPTRVLPLAPPASTGPTTIPVSPSLPAAVPQSLPAPVLEGHAAELELHRQLLEAAQQLVRQRDKKAKKRKRHASSSSSDSESDSSSSESGSGSDLDTSSSTSSHSSSGESSDEGGSRGAGPSGRRSSKRSKEKRRRSSSRKHLGTRSKSSKSRSRSKSKHKKGKDKRPDKGRSSKRKGTSSSKRHLEMAVVLLARGSGGAASSGSGKKAVDVLRAERLQREAVERARQRQVLLGGDLELKNQRDMEAKGVYSSAFGNAMRKGEHRA